MSRRNPQAAPDTMRDAAWAYLEGGAGDVPAENSRQWDRYAVWPRTLAGLREVDLATPLFGATWQVPFAVAPVAQHGLWHDEAEAATATGATLAGVRFGLSQASQLSPERVAPLAPGHLQQVYLPEDRSLAVPHLRRVAASGASALLLTVDQRPVPSEQTFRALDGLRQLPRFSPWDLSLPGSSPAATFSADDVRWLSELIDLPIVVKGILHPDDAVAAIEAGASGVVVSNHGGRQLPGSVSSAEVLRSIALAVGTRGTVLVDSGIRGGLDVFRALCLGAHAALIGRPVIRALARGGSEGVRTYLEQVRSDLATLFLLAGVANVDEAHPEMLLRR